MTPASPLGVFDSGVGGLSVMREIHQLLASENLIYVSDSEHVPYGNKSPEFIVKRCQAISRFLLARGAKGLVVACNTATAASLKTLRAQWPEVPIIGMEPALKPAIAATKVGVVGVLATVGTLRSSQFAALLGKFSSSTKIITQPAPGLVECVERGDLESEKTKRLVASFVEPLLNEGADVIVLGCTHYPFLRKIIEELAGPHVSLIDTGAAVAKQVQRRLGSLSLLNDSKTKSTVNFFSTGELSRVSSTISLLWEPGVLVEFDKIP